MGWGALSDRYGRKPVVLIGLGGVAISSLIFGLAKSYWVALLARFIGGALNGNVAVSFGDDGGQGGLYLISLATGRGSL